MTLMSCMHSTVYLSDYGQKIDSGALQINKKYIGWKVPINYKKKGLSHYYFPMIFTNLHFSEEISINFYTPEYILKAK